MKKALSVFICVCITLLSLFAFASCTEDSGSNGGADNGGNSDAAQKLSAPTVTLTDNVASWSADEKADKFEISLDGNLSYVENTVTTKTLSDGQTIKVRAVGDGKSYTTSDWSNSVTYTLSGSEITPTKLSTPIVTISEYGLASWGGVANASGYVFKINGGDGISTTATSVQLMDGQSVSVKAIGDGTNYTDSDFSVALTYTEGSTTDPAKPTKLDTPTVTISKTGLASWGEIVNASGYVYKINGGAETSTSATSVQLTDGQNITVKAIGNGTTYTDSDFSATKTYTQSQESSGEEPIYLGIFASGIAPSANDGLPDSLTAVPYASTPRLMSGGYRTFDEAIKEYFENSNNHLGESYPKGSDYDLYSREGETVYIQIWLNNPSQHTILSLKLNGTKYQVGGGLSSFFIEESGVHYNCVYVAVTIPSGSYVEKEYTVTDIEYIADTYINADGTDEFMNENDTVSIGLPYKASNPAIFEFNRDNVTVNSASLSFELSDTSGLCGLSGGWLGVAVFDYYDIIANYGLELGKNSITVSGLVENSSYNIIFYLFADTHDGQGVCAHIIHNEYLYTSSAISVEKMDSKLLYDSVRDGYYSAIVVETILNSQSAEYIKLEIANEDDEVVFVDENYNGTATVSEGILNLTNYRVRVYYKDAEYPEGKYIEDYVWVGQLGQPWYQNAEVYTFVTDAIYSFQLNNNDENYPRIDNLTLKLYKEESSRWVAEGVLYLFENPGAIEELGNRIDELNDEKWNNTDYGTPEWDRINAEIDELGALKDYLSYCDWFYNYRADENVKDDVAYWEAEELLGKYLYEFTYDGNNTEDFFKKDKTFFVILDDALTYGFDSLDFEMFYEYDPNDGSGLKKEYTDGYIHLENMFTSYNGTEPINVTLSGGTLNFSLINVDDSMVDREESTFNKGYIYKIVYGSYYEEEKVLYLNKETYELGVDEASWIEEYISRINAGESIDDLYEKYIPKYKDSYSIDLDLTDVPAGQRDITVYTRKIAESYDKDEYDRYFRISVELYKKIEKPTISFDTDYGTVSPDYIEGWEGRYIYEAEDKDGNTVEIAMYDEDGTSHFHLPSAGTKIRVKAEASGYWLESDYSEWYTFAGRNSAPPKLNDYSLSDSTISWYLDNADGISHYVYTINGGEEVRVELNGKLSVELKNNDVFRIKSVALEAAEATGWIDSVWVEYTCKDDRETLGSISLRIEEGSIVWDEVTGASGYIVEMTQNGQTQTITQSNNRFPAKVGATYRVRAVDETLTYRIGPLSEPWTFTVTLSDPEFSSASSTRIRWYSVEYAGGYYYKIGENGEVQSTSSTYINAKLVGIGEKLYVQAYAEGCTSSNWVMIYHNVTLLETPSVTVSRGTASWNAIEGAAGYLYTINDSEPVATTALSVSGLEVGDIITVCATTEEFGYGNSAWSEAKRQLPIFSAPTVDTTRMSSEGYLSWEWQDGVSYYVYEINGQENTTSNSEIYDIGYGDKVRIRAHCDGGEYEDIGEWTDLYLREDTREQLSTPIIAYDPEIGLTVAINDPNVSYYEVMFGQDGYKMRHYPPDGANETEVITNSFAFPENDHTVYVKAVSEDSSYRDSEWASLEITFE